MIVDSKKYSGKCVCGKEHSLDTKFCVIEQGCMKRLNEYLTEFGFTENVVAIYDENTYEACRDRRPAVYKEVVLSPNGLHADNHGVALALAEIPTVCKCLIAIGSGTIHDLTRYCAYELKIPFVSCPTAASVDGFCSSVAAMTWNGFKKTLTAVSPSIVIADIDIISKAPIHLAKSGLGDMLGKYVALTEWKIGNILTGEYFCPHIYDMTKEATDKVVESSLGIMTGNAASYEALTYGLILSGLAMQLLGNSRCASGAEHHISHLIEMEPMGLNAHSSALHGEKVGVATLIVSKEYHELKNDIDALCNDYEPAGDGYIKSFFGERLCESIIRENKDDAAKDITGVRMSEKKARIVETINDIPQYDELYELFRQVNAKSSLDDIGVSEDELDKILEYSPLVRNRLTLMRLRRGCR